MKKNDKQEAAEIVGRLEAQLASIERKIDILIGRPMPQFQPQQAKQANDYRQRNMFKAVCADCKKECEIPFRPRPDRPVYCRECFSRRKNSGNLFKAKQESAIIERDFTRARPAGKKRKASGRRKKR